MGNRLGLVLGSGAARGWAHLGVIEVLQQHQIQADVVVGSSIGSFVGAAYAAGKTAELAQWAKALDPWQIVRMLDVGWHRGGVVAGEKLFSFLEKLLDVRDIEQLAMPYAAVATRLSDGKEGIFSKGPLLEVVRASCAMPGFLPPQQLQGHWYTDGGVVNPVPVSVGRHFDVDIMIAVNLNATVPVHKKPEPAARQVPSWLRKLGVRDSEDSPQAPGVTEVMAKAIDIMQDKITRTRLAAEPPEILLEPNLSDIGILEFHRAEQAMAIGRAAMLAQLPKLQSYLETYRRE